MKMIIDIPEEKAELLSENIETYGGKIEYQAKDMVYDPYTDNFVGQMIDDKMEEDLISKEQYPELFDEKFQGKILSNVFDKIEKAFNNGLGVGHEDVSDIVDNVVDTYIDRLDILRASINEKDSPNDRSDKYNLIVNDGVTPLLTSSPAYWMLLKVKNDLDKDYICEAIKEHDDPQRTPEYSFESLIERNKDRADQLLKSQRISQPAEIQKFADQNKINLAYDQKAPDELKATYDLLSHLDYEIKKLNSKLNFISQDDSPAAPPKESAMGTYMKKLNHLASESANDSPYPLVSNIKEGIRAGVSQYCKDHPEVVAYMNQKKQADKKIVAKER